MKTACKFLRATLGWLFAFFAGFVMAAFACVVALLAHVAALAVSFLVIVSLLLLWVGLLVLAVIVGEKKIDEMLGIERKGEKEESK